MTPDRCVGTSLVAACAFRLLMQRGCDERASPLAVCETALLLAEYLCLPDVYFCYFALFSTSRHCGGSEPLFQSCGAFGSDTNAGYAVEIGLMRYSGTTG